MQDIISTLPTTNDQVNIKDLDTINEAAESFNAEMPMSEMASKVYQNAMDAGFSDIDYTGILAYLKKYNYNIYQNEYLTICKCYKKYANLIQI